MSIVQGVIGETEGSLKVRLNLPVHVLVWLSTYITHKINFVVD